MSEKDELVKAVDDAYIKVKDLEIQLEKMRRNVIEVAEMAYNEASDEFGSSWNDFKFNILYINLKVMTDEEVDE